MLPLAVQRAFQLHQSGAEALLLELLDNLLLMLRAEGFQSDAKFYEIIAVDAEELVVLQLDDIRVHLRDLRSDSYQLARLVRKKYRYGHGQSVRAAPWRT